MTFVELALRFPKLVSDQKSDNDGPRTKKMLGGGLSENDVASDPINGNVPSVFFYFLSKDLCVACPKVSETGLGSKIGQRRTEKQKNARRWAK